jgi:hypothetical protein
MAKHARGGTHTTLIGAAQEVVREIDRLPSNLVNRTSPGRITKPSRSGARRLTFVHTNVGLELQVCGDGVQTVSVHTDRPQEVVEALRRARKLKHFTFAERERRPG